VSVYKLKRPVALGEQGAPITELIFRESVVAGDLRGIKLASLREPATDDMLKIGGRLCGQPDAVMNRLSLEDFGKVMEIVGGFLSDGQPTGSEPSP